MAPGPSPVKQEPGPTDNHLLLLPTAGINFDSFSTCSGSNIPTFVRRLYTVVSNESVDVIAWTKNGMAFEIRNKDVLQNQVLGHYFRQNKYSSFQRQLNNFGFRKWTKTKALVCTFSHPMFRQHRFDLLSNIQRRGARTMPKLSTQLDQMRACTRRLELPIVALPLMDRSTTLLPETLSLPIVETPPPISQDYVPLSL